MNTDLLTQVGAIVVALIAAAAAIAAQRAAAKATLSGTIVTSRTNMETEAYERARRMDVETIERQDEELIEARREIADLKTEVAKLREEMAEMRRRQSSIENEVHPHEESR